MVFFSLMPLAFLLFLWESEPAALRGGYRVPECSGSGAGRPLPPAGEALRSPGFFGHRRVAPPATAHIAGGVLLHDLTGKPVSVAGSGGEWKVTK